MIECKVGDMFKTRGGDVVEIIDTSITPREILVENISTGDEYRVYFATGRYWADPDCSMDDERDIIGTKLPPTRHKHADVIIAWANGEKIEFYNSGKDEWRPLDSAIPSWFKNTKYRVVTEKEQYFDARVDRNHAICSEKLANLKLVFRGDTLFSAEVLTK